MHIAMKNQQEPFWLRRSHVYVFADVRLFLRQNDLVFITLYSFINCKYHFSFFFLSFFNGISFSPYTD